MNITDEFNGKKPALYWQWDFRNSDPLIKQEKGNLLISGTFKDSNASGIAITVRPTDVNYEMSTEVVNTNSSLKGLVIYGDANAAMGIGAIGDKAEFWMVKDNKKVVLAGATIDVKKPVQLKLAITVDLQCHVFWKQGQGGWNELAASTAQSIDFLPQWDRSPRIGLSYKGPADQQAQFSAFSVKYLNK